MKTIGIIGYKNHDDTSFGVGINHIQWASQFGNIRIIMPTDDFVPVDLLYLAGGLDVNPVSYGEVPGYRTSETDVYKQYFLDHKLKAYVDNKVPIFGVCLGMQQLAVYFGSKLTQNLPLHAQSPDRWQVGHKIYSTDTKTAQNENADDYDLEVNSHHHQGILKDNLVPELDVLYYADNEQYISNPIVEAFKHKELPIAGVQWHPEELYDPIAIDIVNDLLK